MPERKENLSTNIWYHVYNRGLNKQSIFFNEFDYERFLEKLLHLKRHYKIKVLAWSLMPNHFHLLIQQDSESGLGTSPDSCNISDFLRRLQQSHAMFIKKKYEKSGAIFSGRFKIKPVETEEYLKTLIHYIHKQAFHHKVAGVTKLVDSFNWPFSSLHDFCFFKNINASVNYEDSILDYSVYREEFLACSEDLFEEEF